MWCVFLILFVLPVFPWVIGMFLPSVSVVDWVLLLQYFLNRIRCLSNSFTPTVPRLSATEQLSSHSCLRDSRAKRDEELSPMANSAFDMDALNMSEMGPLISTLNSSVRSLNIEVVCQRTRIVNHMTVKRNWSFPIQRNIGHQCIKQTLNALIIPVKQFINLIFLVSGRRENFAIWNVRRRRGWSEHVTHCLPMKNSVIGWWKFGRFLFEWGTEAVELHHYLGEGQVQS